MVPGELSDVTELGPTHTGTTSRDNITRRKLDTHTSQEELEILELAGNYTGTTSRVNITRRKLDTHTFLEELEILELAGKFLTLKGNLHH